ncbi:MAG: soluble cytochrome b562 [Oceanospirillaceae bacterium]|jgi:soluble cytochrome b562
MTLYFMNKRIPLKQLFNLLICKSLTRKLFILLILTFTASHALVGTAKTVDGIDLEAVMKQMRFEYNQALKTDSPETMTLHIQAFKHQLSKAKRFPFSKERLEKAKEGLEKVTNKIEQITLPITAQSIDQSKELLAAIDDIKEQYHDKKVSLWDRFYEKLFGEDENNQKLILLD